MKIEEQTRKLAAGCSKHCFEIVDKTNEVSSKHCFEQPAASFLVCFLIFIEYKTHDVSAFPSGRLFTFFI